MNQIIERMFIKKAKNNQSDKGDDNNDDDSGGQHGGPLSKKSASQRTEKIVNKGVLTIDVTCIPTNIAF
jgi:hypothetical protein